MIESENPKSCPTRYVRKLCFAVARIHFPKLKDDYLCLVVNAVLATEGSFVSTIKAVCLETGLYSLEDTQEGTGSGFTALGNLERQSTESPQPSATFCGE
jgi:hypothetical protein